MPRKPYSKYLSEPGGQGLHLAVVTHSKALQSDRMIDVIPNAVGDKE
jgi:hypothetical protein